jgi:hypothetical protein
MAQISSLVKTVAKKALGKVALPVAAVSGAIDIGKAVKGVIDLNKSTKELEAASNAADTAHNALAKWNADRRTQARNDAKVQQEQKNNAQPTTTGVASRGLVSSDPLSKAIDDSGDSSEDAAEDASKAQTKAASNRYNEQVRAAGDAKESAGGQYQWIIDTLGSNKKDLLTKIAMSEGEGISNFEAQEENTTVKYDSARQEILNTYRDLNRNQEKILRGSGTAQSSRSQEATLRLNGLLGKDLSGISKNEADSLALIGSALTSFKNNVLDQRNSIETETKSKLDKAALEYDDMIKGIDQNIYAAKNQKAEAFAQAEAELSEKVASIKQWEAGLKLQAEQTQASMKESLDSFVLDMTDSNGKLNAGLNDKISATNEIQRASGRTELDMNDPSILDNKVGVFQKTAKKYSSLEELQDALAKGEIDAAEAEQQRSALANAPASNDPFKKDPLAMAMMA